MLVSVGVEEAEIGFYAGEPSLPLTALALYMIRDIPPVLNTASDRSGGSLILCSRMRIPALLLDKSF